MKQEKDRCIHLNSQYVRDVQTRTHTHTHTHTHIYEYIMHTNHIHTHKIKLSIQKHIRTDIDFIYALPLPYLIQPV